MLQELTVKRLSVRTFLKLCLIGNGFTFILIWAGLTISALAGAPFVRWEDGYITGRWATLAGPIVVVAIGLMYCAVQSLLAGLGLLLFSKFRSVTIKYLR